MQNPQTMNSELTLEVCCGDLLSVSAAIAGGAHRVELCQALEVDGLTPSEEMMEAAVAMDIPVQVLIRPRKGNFVYSMDEVRSMQRDIHRARCLGVNGVVIGALEPDGSIDEDTIRRLVGEAEGLSITFHRAFDVCKCPEEALEQIISLGCHRLLTSGQAPTAEQGIHLIEKLVEQASDRLIIMPGAGVNVQNARCILCKTGAREIHGSLRKDGRTDSELVRSVVKSFRS